MPSGKAHLRRLTADDASRGAALSKQIGWSHTAETWDNLIRWGGEGSLCIAQDDQLLATTIAVFYSSALAWVGVVITHPDHQRQGLARQLMEAALDYLHCRGAHCIMLDASDMGSPLYASMGFRPLYKVHVFGGTVSATDMPASTRDVSEADVPGIIALDGQVFGVERPAIMRDLARPGQGWVSQEAGTVSGYLLVKPSNFGISIAPWYHIHPEGAAALFRLAVTAANGQPIRVYVPEPNIESRGIVERCGLTPVRHTTRMVLGDEPPGMMERQYSVASLATG